MKRSFLVRAMCAVVGAAAFMPLAMAQPSPQTIEKGFFTVAFTGDMPGTGYQDGSMIGYDGEILQRVADSLKLKVKPALMEWSGTIASVQSKRVDVMAGTMGWTEQRSKIMVRERIDRLLLHLFEHQIHHRGQVHAMLSGTSVKPPQLDEFYSVGEAPLRAVLYRLGEQEPGAGIAALGMSETEQARLYHGTALEWLGLPRTRFE